MTTEYGEKAAIDSRVIQKSVVAQPDAPANAQPPLAATLIFHIGEVADEFVTWGTNVHSRDRQLRAWWPTEPMFASALGIICSRNAAFSWKLSGPESSAKKYQKVLENANWGKGWADFITKFTIDLTTQDNGAFIETVRDTDSPDGELIGVNHLDSARCYHTGNTEAPVIYQDTRGKYHLMKWYQVVPVAEMPAPVEGKYGTQYSALSRMLRAVQVMRNIVQYNLEKTGGSMERAIHLVKGITTQQILDAIAQAKAQRMGQVYSQPVMVGTLDPTADVGHDTIELAAMPDNFSMEEMNKWYVSQLAMAFLEDYQTFAPLPGGNLGTSAQSTVLHMKSRGKGPALFQKLIMHVFNMLILPNNLEFEFDEQDLAEELEDATVKGTRATNRSTRIASGEITPEAARQIALDEGDLSQELFDALGQADITGDVTVDDESDPNAQLGNNPNPGSLGAPPTQAPASGNTPVPSARPGGSPLKSNSEPGRGLQWALRVKDLTEDREDVEDMTARAIEKTMRPLRRRVLAIIGDLEEEDEE